MWSIKACTALQKNYLIVLIYADRNPENMYGNEQEIMVEGNEVGFLDMGLLSRDSAFNVSDWGVRNDFNGLCG